MYAILTYSCVPNKITSELLNAVALSSGPVNLFEPKTYRKKLGELINAVPFFPRGELIRTSKLIRVLRVTHTIFKLTYLPG